MAQDYYAILGLAPGRYSPREIASRFLDRRARLLRELDNPTRNPDCHQHLDELHLAYTTLRDPRLQEEYLRTRAVCADPVQSLRALIAASLEDGLLRCSRRRAILARAQEMGLNEFQAQLLIAQVQFGEPDWPATPVRVSADRRSPDTRTWARLAGIGVLALTMFLYLVHWLGV